MSSIGNTARAGNVLVLLDLYASGLASSTASPTIPMLTSRTMHALYAISLLVYSLNSFLNWIHIYCVLHGLLSSFPLHLWFALMLVVASVSGGMLILMLVMLCVENAFAHRLDITVHKSGLSIICEAFVEWLYGFNNFRIAFLFMVMHDTPITLGNFFLLGACRCAGPNLLAWPLLLSTLGNLLSLGWRLVVLYFAYSRLVFPAHNNNNSAFPSRNQSFRNQFADPSTAQDDAKLRQLDESWPIRWSEVAVYGELPPDKSVDSNARTLYLEAADGSTEKHSLGYCLSWLVLKSCDVLCALFKRFLCVLSSLLLYTVCFGVACLPCLHHYLCRANSYAHRHRCAKSFVRNCTLFFHYAVFFFSLGLSLLLILLNLVLLSSTHLVGPNNWAPEISRLCISVDASRRVIRPLLLPAESLFSRAMPAGVAPSAVAQPVVQCKPLWDRAQPPSLLDEWAPGLARLSPGPWQARFPLADGTVLAVSTHYHSDHSAVQSPRHVLRYDFALLRFGGDNSTRSTQCTRRKTSGWFFADRPNPLGFPYFFACSSTIRIRKGALIDCQALAQGKILA